MTLLALDLEGTLISYAGPDMKTRPFLYNFLEACNQIFDRIYLFTCVPYIQAEKCLLYLRQNNLIPQDFVIPVVDWYSTDPFGVKTEERWPYKDLRFLQNMTWMAEYYDVPIEDIFLVDDDSGFVPPDQLAQWIPIASYNLPYSDDDRELLTCLDYIRYVLYNRSAWFNEPPKRTGYYWYYGKAYTTVLEKQKTENKLHFVEVAGRSYITNGWKFYPNPESGVWKPVQIPPLPGEKDATKR